MRLDANWLDGHWARIWKSQWLSRCRIHPPVIPELQEAWVQSLGREDPRGEAMATHSSILAWEIPWTEEPGGLQSEGSKSIAQN